jgi:cob(I)alamin adenosyltransferase
MTSIGGAPLSKDDSRVECLGALDELDAFLADAAGSSEIIDAVRRELSAVIMPAVCGIRAVSGTGRLESWIAKLEERGSSVRFGLAWKRGAKLNLARTVCRRAERRAVTFGRLSGDYAVAVYLNRLSDLLFLLASAEENAASGDPNH